MMYSYFWNLDVIYIVNSFQEPVTFFYVVYVYVTADFFYLAVFTKFEIIETSIGFPQFGTTFGISVVDLLQDRTLKVLSCAVVF